MIEAIRRIVAADSVEAVWAVLTCEMAGFGFDRLLYGMTRFRTANSLGNREDMLILSNHPDDYVERFLEDGLFRTAPMVNWASEHVGAMSWSWIQQLGDDLPPETRAVIEFNRRHDVVAGYTISFPWPSSRQRAAIALTARAGISQAEVDCLWARSGADIDLINQIAHLKLAALPSPENLRKLTERQRQVLEWVGDGKNIADIAMLMKLTPATIEKHLRNARETLQVATTAQAVMKASLQKQIFVAGA